MIQSILFFNENPMPQVYSRGTIAAKELRLRAALSEIDEVHVIAPPGKSIQTADISRGPLEVKIIVHRTISWPYYGMGILHFFYGIYYILKCRPVLLEAESAIISGPAVVLLGRIFKLPTIVELRASYEELIKVHVQIIPFIVKKILLQIVTQFSYSLATAIIANSRTYQLYLEARGFQSVIINPGLQYVPETRNGSKRKNVLCYLGRLVEEKGVDDLLCACAKLKLLFYERSWALWVVGEGIKKEHLIRMTSELGIQDFVTFKGSQPNFATLSQVKILVNPCFVKHPLEMVNVEASFMGVPVICYGDNLVPETVLHNKTGIKVDYRDVSSLAKTIQKLMKDEARCSRLGEAGRMFAKKNYSFRSQVDQLRNLYSALKII